MSTLLWINADCTPVARQQPTGIFINLACQYFELTLPHSIVIMHSETHTPFMRLSGWGLEEEEDYPSFQVVQQLKILYQICTNFIEEYHSTPSLIPWGQIQPLFLHIEFIPTPVTCILVMFI